MIALINILATDTCTTYGIFNPTIVIQDPHTQPALYLAYKVYYVNWYVGKYLQRYISMDVPVGQTRIIATFYGFIDKICTDEANNIVGIHAVAKVIDLQEINDLIIAASHFVITDPTFRRCYMKENNGVQVFIEITPDLNNYVLDILPTSTLQTYTFDFSTCESRVYMDLTPSDGTVYANTNDVIFPVFNQKLKEYGADYGDFLYPIVFINSTVAKNKGRFSTPTNAIQSDYDVVEISSSILFGHEYQNQMEYVMAGNDSRFENVTISGKCVQFYANSPRNIEYPLMSGIVHSMQSHSSALDAGSKVYTQYYGPKVCVQNFVYMPVFFLTAEDPVLKEACDRLPTIQANFTKHVKDGTWEYLDPIDKSPTTPSNDQAIKYTQSMIDQLQSTCHKAYFLPKYSKNLANTISIVDILYLVILISMIAIQFVLTKRNIENEVFAKIADNKERKRLFIEILVAISIMTLMIVLIIVYIKYSTQLLIIVSIFVVALITYSYYHYVRISDQQHLGNINIVVETHQKVRTRIGTIIIQLIIQVIVNILEMLLNITAILQMLQYMKFQYYQNRITNIGWLINPANVILKTAQSLGKGVYPFIFLVVSLVNQELTKGKWFKKLIRKPKDPLNMNMFLLMKLLKLFQYFHIQRFLRVHQQIAQIHILYQPKHKQQFRSHNQALSGGNSLFHFQVQLASGVLRADQQGRHQDVHRAGPDPSEYLYFFGSGHNHSHSNHAHAPGLHVPVPVLASDIWNRGSSGHAGQADVHSPGPRLPIHRSKSFHLDPGRSCRHLFQLVVHPGPERDYQSGRVVALLHLRWCDALDVHCVHESDWPGYLQATGQVQQSGSLAASFVIRKLTKHARVFVTCARKLRARISAFRDLSAQVHFRRVREHPRLWSFAFVHGQVFWRDLLGFEWKVAVLVRDRVECDLVRVHNIDCVLGFKGRLGDYVLHGLVFSFLGDLLVSVLERRNQVIQSEFNRIIYFSAFLQKNYQFIQQLTLKYINNTKLSRTQPQNRIENSGFGCEQSDCRN
ncbi:Hypothetical_protein [Hexamita inflata]|uniref:Hypothetical_protein n=1 Tax=Hexamita inflata TaxID=28002 RepID=A0AA86U085_9EUKA|nr:Hypothetical protein HINF_LOCUS22919 [Hexamita inflata]